MRFNGNKSQMEYLLLQNKIISHEKNENIENRIETPTGCVTKCLQGDELSEGGMKKIYERNDLLFWHNPQIPGAKLI